MFWVSREGGQTLPVEFLRNPPNSTEFNFLLLHVSFEFWLLAARNSEKYGNPLNSTRIFGAPWDLPRHFRVEFVGHTQT